MNPFTETRAKKEKCEFCEDDINYHQQCDECGGFYHELCMTIGLCPFCEETQEESD